MTADSNRFNELVVERVVPVVPSPEGFLFTAILEFVPTAGGTLYRATARHATRADMRAHSEMGFEAGWGAALDQLTALA